MIQIDVVWGVPYPYFQLEQQNAKLACFDLSQEQGACDSTFGSSASDFQTKRRLIFRYFDPENSFIDNENK